MKRFDIKASINPETYIDEFSLTVTEKNKQIAKIDMDSADLLELEREVKHAVDTNIC